MKSQVSSSVAGQHDAPGLILCGVLLALLAAACISPFQPPLLQVKAVGPGGCEPASPLGAAPSPAGEVPSGCTVFTVSKGDQVFFGGNDDYFNPDSYYWVDPGNGKDYGAIWIGTPDNVQQGVNEKGLAYDANGLPRVDVNPHRERIPVIGDYTSTPRLN